MDERHIADASELQRRTRGVVEGFSKGELTRKQFISRAVALGLSAPAIASVLAACGGESTSEADGPSASGGTGAATTAAQGAGGAGEPQRGGTLVSGMSVEPLNLDTVTMNWSDESSLDLYERLNILTSEGEYVGQLAKSWDVSPEGTEYTYRLRPGKTFHDGQPVNAAAVKAFFDTIRNPDSGYIWAGVYLSRIESIEAPDDATVVFRLTEPDNVFQFGLANTYAGVVSIAARDEAGEDFGTSVVVGSGPFRLESWVAGDAVSVVRYPDYANGGPAFENQGAPRLDGVSYRYLGEAASRSLEIESGNVSVVRDVPFQDVERLRGSDDIEIVSMPSWDIPIFMFNLEKPLFQDVRVRLAIAQAIDKQAIVDAITFGNGRSVNSPIVPQALEYSPETESLYPFDPEASRSLLGDAGWSGSGTRMKDGQAFTTSLSIWDTSTQRQQAQIIQNNLSQVGIDCELAVADKASLNAALTEGNFDMGTIDISWDDALTVTQLFFDSVAIPFPNYARYSNPRVDELFAQARSVDLEERKQIAAEIQRILLDDMPAVYLYNYDRVYAVRRDVQAFEASVSIWSFCYPRKLDIWLSA